MNMTSEDTPVAPEQAPEEQPKFTEAQLKKMQENLRKMQNDPEMMRRFQNMQRRDMEFEELMKMEPERRSALLFHGQCVLDYYWRENLKARDKREREKEQKAA